MISELTPNSAALDHSAEASVNPASTQPLIWRDRNVRVISQDTNVKKEAQVYLAGHFGSISDGETALDGNLANVEVNIREVDG